MALTTPQQQIFDDPARFRCVAAGRRFGKTYLSTYEIARVARYPNKRVFYIAPSFRMGKQIIWQWLCDEMRLRRWIKKINESDLTITLVNGSTVSIRSADNPDSMRGVSLDLAILDEAAYMNPETWTHVIRPTLSDRKGKALFISTPNGVGDWFHDLWVRSHNLDDYAAYQFRTIDGGQVTPEEVEAARAELDLRTYRQEYEATFETSGNTVYHAFEMSNVQKWTEAVPHTLHIGIDFNIDPVTSIICAKTADGLHIIDEIIIPVSNTQELAQTIQEKYGSHQLIAYPDPAGRQRRTSAGGKTDMIILEEHGMRCRAPRAHPPVKDRINSVNRLLCDASGTRRLFVDPACRKSIEMFQKLQYKPGTSLPDKDSGYDHTADAIGYAVHFMYPIRRPAPEIKVAEVFRHL